MQIRKLFDDAVALSPSILFLDEIDAITGKRDASSRGMERRMVAQLQLCMDRINRPELRGTPVIVIGATNRPDALDAALRRAGRFDREICLGIPQEPAREQILRTLIRGKVCVEPDLDFAELAAETPGYVGADLKALIYPPGECG